MIKARAILVGVIVFATAVGAYKWWRSTEPSQDSHGEAATQPLVQPDAQTQQATQDQKRREEAQGCLDEGLRRLHQQAAEQPEQRENIELEENWLEYLQRIQAEGDFPNWSGGPCDLYLQTHAETVARAVDMGFATMEVRGDGLQKVTITVTSTPGHPIVNQSLLVPVGTLFTSSSAGTQSMIAASSIRFQFYPAAINSTDNSSSSRNEREMDFTKIRPQPAVFHPDARPALRNAALHLNVAQSVAQNVPSYCINRWREVPDTEAHFSVAELEESNPLRKLVACLDQNPAEHGMKQLAVWMLSDHLLDLTPQELADKFFAESDAHAVQTPAEFAESLKKNRPDISENDLEEIRSMPPEQFQQARVQLLRAQAEKEVKSYLEITRPLLEGCGVEVSGSAFFR